MDSPDLAVPLPAETPLLFAGHSHLIALCGDRYENPPNFRPLDQTGSILVLDGVWPRTDVYWDALIARAPGADVALMWGGSEHNVCYFFENAYQFDFLSSYVNKLMPSFKIVPRSRIMKRFREISIDQLIVLLGRLQRAGARSVTLIGSPPPKKDNDELRKILRNEPFFVDWAAKIGEDIDTIRITLPHVRLKLWFLLQDLVAEAARTIGAGLIAPPAETVDEEGFLLPQYWHQDITHANPDYGAIVLKKVMSELRHGREI